ncbi:MAG: hypothetical protein KF741_01615 [Ferruginibacter sp.]|nr:hypothetical protein [Bacteroidota bacterium]MBX2917915.1 hypothetical protein [Ferruginibacter sp.]MCB0709859.1 hypothetical protein [Chitinophagaceae bacterium]
MKRRTFLISATAVTLAAVSIPAIKYIKGRSKHYDSIVIPDELSRFCDEKTLRAIGKSYRIAVPQEKDKATLKKLLLTDNKGKVYNEKTDSFELIEMLDAKIHDDFEKNSIFVLNGWIIAQTEARQCALFSLT